jgi:hypothetical protein
MSLVPYRDDRFSLIERGFALSIELLFHAHYVYYWLRDVAPIIVKYKLKQLKRDGIDGLPFLSWEIKQEIKRWLKDFQDFFG